MSRIFLPFVPNWANGVRDTYEFLTDLFVARNGNEQRRSQRVQPRRSITAAMVLDADRGRVFKDILNRAKLGEIEIPDYTAQHAVAVSATVVPGATVLTLDTLPAWFAIGQPLAVMLTDRTAVRAVPTSRNGRTVTFTSTIHGADAGCQILPLLPALLGTSNTLQQPAGYDVLTTSATFTVEPGTELREPVPLTEGQFGAAALFNGRYVLLRKPNLLQAPVHTLNLTFETVDYRRGVVRRFAPVPAISRTLSASWVAATRKDAEALLDVFLRCKGRAGEIYLPTWGADLPKPIARGTGSLTFAGTDVLAAYGGNEAHKTVLITSRSGDMIPLQIASMGESSGNTVMWFEGTPPAINTIERMSWMYVARFAQDSLTIEWLTDEVANIAMSFVTLVNLPVDDTFGGNWILTTGYWRDEGEWVDDDVWKDG